MIERWFIKVFGEHLSIVLMALFAFTIFMWVMATLIGVKTK